MKALTKATVLSHIFKAMRKGERTRLEIIERARRLFMEKGFSGTSMSDICASLSLSRGGLYRHFSCLEEVFIACLKDDAEIWEQELDRVLGLGLDSRLILNRYLEVKEAEIQEGSGRLSLCVYEYLRLAQKPDSFIASRFGLAVSMLGRMLSYGKKRGELEINDVQALSELLVTALDGIAIAYIAENDKASLKRQLGQLKTMMLGGTN